MTTAPAPTDAPAATGGRRTRVAVIGGGRSSEHDVSVASARGVAAALDPLRYDVVPLVVRRDGTWAGPDGVLGPTPARGLAAALRLLEDCDVTIPMVHGPVGEDGTLAALLDLAGIAYVGSGVRAGALAMDKWVTKLVAQALGIAVAPGVLLTRAHPRDPVHLPSLPVVVKPVAAGSSHGVTLVHRVEDLPAALEAAFALDDRVLVEQVVRGREVDVAVLCTPDGPRVGPPLEIGVPADRLFDTDLKYGGDATFTVPAALPAAVRLDLEQAALAVVEALGCDGVARVDFFVTEHDVVLNEVNTTPGMTEHSQVPRVFSADGLPYPALIDTLVAGALATRPVLA